MQTPKKSPGNRRSFATPASPSSPHRTPASFSTLLKKEFRHQHDMRKLLIAALTDTNKDAIVRLLASPRGLKQLSHILSCAFTLDAGATSHLVSFQSVAVPLCCLLSHPDIRHSVRVSDISTVYECLLRHRTFFLRYVNLLDEVFHTREGQIFDKRLRSVDLTYYQPSSSIDCAVPFLSMCYAVVQTVYQARSDAIWEDILPGILDYVHKYITGCNDTSKQAQELLRLIDRLTEICSAKSKYLKSPNTDKNSLEGNVASEAEIEAFMNEGPGSFRQNGPRHDNDAADFRQIQVVPNQSEIACLLSPYLPFQSGRLAGASNSWMDDDVDRHLDIQFRLTREDMIAPLRKAIHHFFQSNILGTTSKKHHFKFYDDHRSQGGSCLLLRNVEVAGLSASHVNGTLVRLEFDQIFPANKESERQTSWDYGYGYHLLQSKSIVCIALNVQYVENKNNLEGCPDALRQPITREGDDERNHIDLGGARLVFAFVHYEGRNQLGKSKDRCTTLHVQPVAQDDTFFLMEMLSRRKNTEQSNTTNVILQVRGHFVAGSIPVLHSLQRSRLKELPWAVKLTDRNLLRDKSTNKDQVSVEASPAFASYISPSTRYDLSFLAKDSAELPPEFKNVALVDYNGVMKLLHNNKKEISLDESQIESFVSGLSHEIAMIQGPPGCGKTYIGVKIIQALLNNSAGVPDSNWSRSRTGIRPPATPDEDSPSPFLDPILCVCYTNHALDQFLTALLDTGAVGLNDVVRIGSMSKNETLKSRSLEPLARSISGVHRRDIAICRSHCAEAEHRIAELVTSATSTKQRSKAFGKWMQENHAEFCEEVVLSSTLLKHLPIEGNSNTTYQVEAKGEAKIPEVLHSDEVEGNTVLEREQGFQLVGNFATMLESYLCFGDVAERVTRQEKIDKLREEFDKSTASKMKELFDHHERWFSVMNESKNVSKIACLRRARVIGCTTSGAAKYNDLIQALAPAVIICEEAAEVLESHMLASLSSRTKQLILIGDHLQLRPKVSEFRLSRESNRNHDLDISLFERIATNGFLPVSKLCTQRRMHTTISQIPRETLYPYLIDSTTVMNPPACPRGFQTPLFFVTHREHEHDPTNESLTSFKNVHEGEFICALARYVIRQGYEPHQIAILTPYVGQLLLFREILLRERILVHIDEHDLKDLQIAGFNVDGKELSSLTFENTSGNPRDSPASIASEDLRKAKLTSLKECLRLSTVDNFQGEEAEIVLVSTVRCNDRGSVGFLKFRNRVNVMLTRAKHGMYIIGSAETIRSSPKAHMFQKVLDILSSQHLVGPSIPLRCENHGKKIFVSRPECISVDGGCEALCSARKICGHMCRRRCHPDDRQHLIQDCLEDCQRLLPGCKHPCRRLCYETCGNCQFTITVKLSCGHEVDTVCTKRKDYGESYKCREIIASNVVQDCGHVNDVECWEKESKKCRKMCAGIRECGHVCRNMCFECTESGVGKVHTGSCKEACGRVLLCGHTCNVSPCHDANSCPPCSSTTCDAQCEHSTCPLKCNDVCFSCCERCTWKCTCEAQLKCNQLCATPCLRVPCDTRCEETLDCGHQCPSICGERCPSKKYCVTCASENKKYTKKTQNQVVDYITMRKLKDLGEETEEDSSIIVLPCGHAFTVETLDGILEISIFYRRNSEGKWSTAVGLDELKSLQKGPYDMKERTRPRCPVCKHALYGINRYKRIIAFHDLVTIQRKWVVMAHIRYQSIMNSIDKLWKALREYSESITSIGSTRANSCNRILAIHKQAQNQSKEAESFVKDTEDKGPTTDLYNMEVANALKGENRLDQKSLEEMQPDPLPTFLARESNMKCILLMVRIACYFIEEQQGNDNGNQSSTKEPLKELQGVEKQAIQLKRTEALREKAQKEFHELLRYTASHSYGKRRKEVVKTYASSLYEIFSDLDNIGFSFMPDVSSTTSQKTECAMEVEELGKELSYLKKLASDMMEKLSSIAYRPVSMEEKKMVFHALASDVGTGIAGFGGHYYRCPNGHTYAIADCGGAVIESQCPECGATIGGTHHRLSSGNEVDPEFREIAWVEGRSYG